MAEIKKSKRGGARKGAGRKPKAQVEPAVAKSAKEIVLRPVDEPEATKKPPQPRKPGRPEEYSDEVYFDILLRMEDGATLSSICDEEGMPCTASVRAWKNSKPEYLAAYLRAREEQQHARADLIIDIGDDGRNDWMEKQIKGQTFTVLNKEAVERSKLRCENLKWLMARLAPRTFTEKGANEGGKEGDGKVIPVINVTIGRTESSPAS